MNLRTELIKTFAFTYRNLVMTRRNVFLLGDMVYWPLIAVLSIGFMLAYLKPGDTDVAVVLSGVVAMSVLQTCQLDVAYSLLFDLWSKSIKHTLVAPVGARHYLAGSWLFGIARGTLTFFVLYALIRAAFGFDLLRAGAGPTLVFLAGMFLCGLIIGIIIIVLLYTFGMRAEVAAWTIVSFLLIVSGIYYPVSVLPPWLKAVAHAMPLTYFLEAWRAPFGHAAAPGAAAKGFALSAVYIAAAYFLLHLSGRRAMRRGIIMKLSE